MKRFVTLITRNDEALTSGEIDALRKILRRGGLVRVGMGRKGPDIVRTATLNKLRRAGYVKGWNDASRAALESSMSTGGTAKGKGIVFNLYVTPEGVRKLAETETRRSR